MFGKRDPVEEFFLNIEAGVDAIKAHARVTRMSVIVAALNSLIVLGFLLWVRTINSQLVQFVARGISGVLLGYLFIIVARPARRYFGFLQRRSGYVYSAFSARGWSEWLETRNIGNRIGFSHLFIGGIIFYLLSVLNPTSIFPNSTDASSMSIIERFANPASLLFTLTGIFFGFLMGGLAASFDRGISREYGGVLYTMFVGIPVAIVCIIVSVLLFGSYPLAPAAMLARIIGNLLLNNATSATTTPLLTGIFVSVAILLPTLVLLF